MPTLKEFYGQGLVNGTMTTSTAAARDNTFNALSGTPTLTSEKIVFSTAAGSQTLSWTGLSAASATLRTYLNISGTFATVPLLQFQTSVPALICSFGVNSSGQMVVRDSAGSAGSRVQAVSAGDYVVDMRYASGTGLARVVVYTLDGTQVWDTGNYATASAAAVGQVILGRGSGTVAGPFSVWKPVLVDSVAVIGPDPGTTAPPAPSRKYGELLYSGGVWK